MLVYKVVQSGPKGFSGIKMLLFINSLVINDLSLRYAPYIFTVSAGSTKDASRQ